VDQEEFEAWLDENAEDAVALAAENDPKTLKKWLRLYFSGLTAAAKREEQDEDDEEEDEDDSIEESLEEEEESAL
jgi:hypothetical protein